VGIMTDVDPPIHEAEFCYQPTLGRYGLSVWDWVPFPVVAVRFSESKVDIPSIDRRVGITLFSSSWTAKYQQIECVEAFHIPWYLPLWTLGHASVPFGIRIRMKDSSRARVFLFSRQCTQLLEAFASYGVPVTPNPKRLNFMFIGRK
jgi:hypothetical protein